MIDFLGLFDGLCKSISSVKSAVGIKEDETTVTYAEKRELVAKRRLERIQQTRAKNQKQSNQKSDGSTQKRQP